MPSVLFIGSANAARSQLAEAITRALRPELQVWSAGQNPSHVRPQVRAVLEEVGMDARGLRAKSIYEVPLDEIDMVVSLALVPPPPDLPHVSWPLPDPSSAPEAESMEAYRATRDELQRRLPSLLADLAARG